MLLFRVVTVPLSGILLPAVAPELWLLLLFVVFDVSRGGDRLSLLPVSLPGAPVATVVKLLAADVLPSVTVPPSDCGGPPPLLLPDIVVGGRRIEEICGRHSRNGTKRG
uniref:Putative secreted protein n=1 Tax=Anopheles darlingi TaxID=43151 RepID=A0A2M4DKV8_ANODA